MLLMVILIILVVVVLANVRTVHQGHVQIVEKSMMRGEQDSMLKFPSLMRLEKTYRLKSRHMIFQSHR